MNTPNVDAGRLERRVRLLKRRIEKMQIIGYIANSGWHDDLMNLYDKLISANKELDNYQNDA